MKRILFVMLAATLCMSLLTGCFFISDTPENPKETTGNGHREYDSNHPDDSERNPFFCITSAAFDENFRVERKEDNSIYIAGEYLFGGVGNECNSFYTSDLTGDGYPELCFGMNFGSDVVDKRIVIVDYKTKQTIYTKQDRENYDYYLFLRDGVLCVKETKYHTKDAVRTGVLTYQNSEITILWDSEVNATYDRDTVASGQPIS